LKPQWQALQHQKNSKQVKQNIQRQSEHEIRVPLASFEEAPHHFHQNSHRNYHQIHHWTKDREKQFEMSGSNIICISQTSETTNFIERHIVIRKPPKAYFSCLVSVMIYCQMLQTQHGTKAI